MSYVRAYVMDSRLVLRRQHLCRRQVRVGAKEGNLQMTMTEELPTCFWTLRWCFASCFATKIPENLPLLHYP
ncbi:hypothetical protein NDU88_008789 [Pleurodeles waltl]|uniref:Uncharacterized protein n=1 Tax=Pleurodeles waltl TaxID=8319 RepID=A0AAV7QVS4_PLEWA|nr:hypothetical protein NDU88_008789 [Pleurodeles waltl]